jgi:nitrous oxide reductase accessory protein NosL
MTRTPPDPVHHLTRRETLAAGGSLATLALAGCTSLTGGETPAAVSLAGGLQCDNCGMVVEKHPGPNGQVFFADESPEGHENPARFDALKQCLFPYTMEREQRGWTTEAVYVTDYSTVDYDVSGDGQPRRSYISSHVAPESFALAEDLYYVVDSDIRGAMGQDFVPFSVEADAEAFVDEYDGRIVRYDDIGPALVGK